MQNSPFTDRLKKEFEYIRFPEPPWLKPSQNQFDVVIIGAGMAGLAAAFALKKLGLSKLKIFDKSPLGYEGPWATYARMPTLRSTKALAGPALDFPLLTFQAWYEDHFSRKEWDKLGKIPTSLWMEYLSWFRNVLNLDIENEKNLRSIQPVTKGLNLVFDDEKISTSKVILATGRGGFGGSNLPLFIQKLPPVSYSLANGKIDFRQLENRKIGIIGGGAAGFDAAAAAIASGCLQANIILRHEKLPYVNKAASLTYSGFFEGYYNLSDEKRWKLMEACYRDGSPPPYEAVERVINHPRFSFERNVQIEDVKFESSKIYLKTSRGQLVYDYLIFATGFSIDVTMQPELQSFASQIQLWSDRKSTYGLQGPDWFYRSPYLGPHFQFLEKNPERATYLKDIYCFNYAATLSHGLVSGDIPGIGVGASRLARGVVSDFFEENWDDYNLLLESYQTPELDSHLQ